VPEPASNNVGPAISRQERRGSAVRKCLSVLIFAVIFIGGRLRSIYGLILLKTGQSDQVA